MKREGRKLKFINRPKLKMIKRNIDFLIIDDKAERAGIRLFRKSAEFFKLDHADQDILLLYLTKKPQCVRSWLDFLRIDYEKKKSIRIDSTKLYNDAKELVF